MWPVGTGGRGIAPLQSGFFQVVEVWHSCPGRAGKPGPILAHLAGYLLGVAGPLGPVEGRHVPVGLDLSGQSVGGGLAALGLGGAGAGVAPPLTEASLGGGVGQRLEAQFGGRGLVGGGGGEVQELAQGFEWLALRVGFGQLF